MSALDREVVSTRESPPSSHAVDLAPHCPACGEMLLRAGGCKMRCVRCGYFDSCSDFYNRHAPESL